MITFAPIVESRRTEPMRLEWLPLIALTAAALLLSTQMPPWAGMWLIAIALFAGFKWWTWRRAVKAMKPVAARSLAYLLLWPGMSARAFLSEPAQIRLARQRQACLRCPGSLETISSEQEVTPKTLEWTWALTKTLFGATLLWGIARLANVPTQNNSVISVIPSLPSAHPLLAGWIGMVGFIFMLHFGLFALLSLFWQSRGIDAPPLMKCPIAAQSLHDFWGRRWNAGFHDIVSGLFFLPMARRLGATAAAILTFVISGLIHELVITVPAGAGYGLPTLYFTLQGAGLVLERSRFATSVAAPVRAWISSHDAHGFITGATRLFPPGRLFAIAVVVVPIGALFPPVFVLRVMVPFLQCIHAL